MVARTSAEAARQTMLQAGLMPLTDYVDAKSLWPCRCTTCGHEYNSTYDRAKQGRGCPNCANLARIESAALARRMPRSTLDDIFAKLNLQLIGEYKSSHVPLSLRCLTCGETFQGTLRRQKSGYSVSCPTCSARTKNARFEPYWNQLNELLGRESAKLLGTAPTNKFHKIRIKCPAGHEFSTTVLGALGRESFCHDCTAKRNGPLRGFSRKVSLDIQEIRIKLRNHGWVLLQEPTTISEDVQLSCMLCGGQSHSRLYRAYSGSFVCQCRKDAKKRESVSALLAPILEKNQGKLISAVPLRTKDYGTFECAKGHKWSAVLGSITGNGSWCPKCSGNFARSLDELRVVAESRGGKLISNEYKGVDATYQFTCILGHEFSNMFKKVEGGQWCPTCNRGTKSEEITRTYFEEIFGSPFKKARPKWLRNSRGRQMELDGYSPELQIAFEYQGIQHFKEFGLYKTNLEQRIIDDELKFKLCQDHKIYLFYLTYKDSYEDFPNLIKKQAKDFNLEFPEEIFEKEVDLTKAYLREDRLEELRQLLAPKKIKVLSTVWLTSNAKYSFECEVCGHLWQALGNAFFNSRSVSGCIVCTRKTTAETNRGSLEDLKKFAATFGGEVLSNEYVRRRHYYKWRCAKGHEFERNYNNMAFRQQFCPECEGTVIRKPKVKT